MGSAGSGKFGTYPSGKRQVIGNEGIGSTSNTFGEACEIECPTVIEHISLEDIATSEYYVNNQSLPSKDILIEVSNKVYRGRLVVKVVPTNEILGNIPTEYNYLKVCIEKGIQYTCSVIALGEKPVPFLSIKLHA
jgi:hypothetical protein